MVCDRNVIFAVAVEDTNSFTFDSWSTPWDHGYGVHLARKNKSHSYKVETEGKPSVHGVAAPREEK